jgi:hypothetical protein
MGLTPDRVGYTGLTPVTRDRRIFVQIPAYRDPELGPTLHDLFNKARHPKSLRVAVLWQRGPGDELDCRRLKGKNLEIIEIPHGDSKGCNWARSELQRFWGGEPYTLILDSHHRFTQHWDQKLLDAYDSLKGLGIEKPVVTAYLPPYNPLTEPRGRRNRPLKIYPFDRSDGLLLRLIGRPILGAGQLTAPVPGEFVSLHCLFTAGEFNREVPFDPNCYFFGDEVSTSLRAFTHGYDIFHPHRVIGWHCYDRAYRPAHWDDHPNWERLEAASLQRLRTLLSGRTMSVYGRGDRRSLDDFEDRLLVKLCEMA